MKGKKGQVTFFIILGVVLLITVGLTLLVRFVLVEEELEEETEIARAIPYEASAIEIYIDSCLKKASEEVAWQVGARGGYLGVSDITTVNFQGEEVPYLLSGATSFGLSLSEIEEDMENEIKDIFENCSDLSFFKEMGFNVTRLGQTLVDVSLMDETIRVELTYPLSIKKREFEIELRYFTVTLPIRLGSLYDSSLELISNIKSSQPYNITQDCYLYDTNNKTNIYFKGGNIIQLMDFSTYEHEYLQTYVFQFAVEDVQVTGGCFG